MSALHVADMYTSIAAMHVALRPAALDEQAAATDPVPTR
jgi:hypothetical protein